MKKVKIHGVKVSKIGEEEGTGIGMYNKKDCFKNIIKQIIKN